MTTLSLSEAPPPDPIGPLLSRVKWSVVAPWLVTAAMFGANGYHRFLSGEQARESDTKTIQQLVQRVGALEQQNAVITAILQRIEAQQSADVLARMRGRR